MLKENWLRTNLFKSTSVNLDVTESVNAMWVVFLIATVTDITQFLVDKFIINECSS